MTFFDNQFMNGFTRYNGFIWIQLILGKKPCFLGPSQLARQKVNIHYLNIPLPYSSKILMQLKEKNVLFCNCIFIVILDKMLGIKVDLWSVDVFQKNLDYWNFHEMILLRIMRKSSCPFLINKNSLVWMQNQYSNPDQSLFFVSRDIFSKGTEIFAFTCILS